MDVVVEKVNELTRKLIITLPPDQVAPDVDAAYDKIRREVKLKGFRKGKVPRSILEKTYRGQVEAEVGEQLIQATYFDAVEQEGIDPVVHPDIREAAFKDGSFVYVAEVDVKPEVELKQYKGLEIEKPPVDVSDEDVDARIEELRREHAPLRSAGDRPIQEGDIVLVDLQGFHKGTLMKQVRNDNMSIDVGAGELDPKLEKALEGLRKGEQTLYETAFPPEYPNPLLAGKTVEFKIDIKDVKERVLPDPDDEFARDVNGECQGMEDLRGRIREEIRARREETAEGDLNDRIMLKLLEIHQFDVPERLVRYEIEEIIKQIEGRLDKHGLTLESAGMNRADLARKNRDAAERRVRGDFILKKIAEVEGIKVEDEDIERGFQRIADTYNMTVPEVKQYFQRREEILPFVGELLNEKILAFLREHAVYVEPAPESGAAREQEDSGGEPEAAQAEAAEDGKEEA